jgi:hypothetical protein
MKVVAKPWEGSERYMVEPCTMRVPLNLGTEAQENP